MMRTLLMSAFSVLVLATVAVSNVARAQDNSADKIEEAVAKEKAAAGAAASSSAPEAKEADKKVPPVQRKAPAKAKEDAQAKAKAADGKPSNAKPADGEEKPAASSKPQAPNAGTTDAEPRRKAAPDSGGESASKADAPRKPTGKAKANAADAEPAGAPLANCEELKNDNGLRIVIYPPSAKSARLAIFDRGSNKELEKDLFPATQGSAMAYARVIWGTRNTPRERLLKGAFLISGSEKDRYYEGMLMADGGDGSFQVHRAHLGKPDEDQKRWTLMLDSSRSLSCRVGN